jgi:hypothetical protein
VNVFYPSHSQPFAKSHWWFHPGECKQLVT